MTESKKTQTTTFQVTVSERYLISDLEPYSVSQEVIRGEGVNAWLWKPWGGYLGRQSLIIPYPDSQLSLLF